MHLTISAAFIMGQFIVSYGLIGTNNSIRLLYQIFDSISFVCFAALIKKILVSNDGSYQQADDKNTPKPSLNIQKRI